MLLWTYKGIIRIVAGLRNEYNRIRPAAVVLQVRIDNRLLFALACFIVKDC